MRTSRFRSAREARLIVACAGGMFTAVVAAFLSPDALAQQRPAADVPDYAGALDAPLVEVDSRTGKARELTPVEIERISRVRNPQRTERQRVQAQAVNREIAAMPGTATDAKLEAKTTARGGTTTLTSREEIMPIYGVPGKGRALIVTHSTGADRARNNDR